MSKRDLSDSLTMLDTRKWCGRSFSRPTLFRTRAVLEERREVFFNVARIEEAQRMWLRAVASGEINFRQGLRLGCVGWRLLLHA